MLININDLLIFLAVFVGVVLGIAVMVLLIIALVRLIKTLGKVNRILDANAENIEKTVQKLPMLTESLERTITSVDETMNGVNDAFFEPKSSNDMVTTVITIVESVIDLILNVFSKKSK